jgi:hypothetical protein
MAHGGGVRGRAAAIMTLVAAPAVVILAITAGSGGPSAAANRRVALADAKAQLACLHLPRGAVRSAAKPAGEDGPAYPTDTWAGVRTGTPGTTGVGAYWTAPGSPLAAEDFVEGHPPAGSKAIASESGYAKGYGAVIGFQWPPVTNVLASRTLTLVIEQLKGGGTGFNAYSAAAWITPRGRLDQIPAGARELRVLAGALAGIGFAGPPRRALITSQAAIRKTVALLDSLPFKPPGADYSCGFACRGLAQVRLTFYGRSTARPLATAVYNYALPRPSGGRVDPIEWVSLTLGSKLQQPPLMPSWQSGSGVAAFPQLFPRLQAALRLSLPTKLPG